MEQALSDEGEFFADLGFEDAANHLVKAGLVVQIDRIIEERGLTQKAPELSAWACLPDESAQRGALPSSPSLRDAQISPGAPGLWRIRVRDSLSVGMSDRQSNRERAMNIEITRPEVEALIEQRLRSGGFATTEEMIFQALRGLDNGRLSQQQQHQLDVGRDVAFTNLSDLLLHSPFAGAELDLERSRELPRSVDIR